MTDIGIFILGHLAQSMGEARSVESRLGEYGWPSSELTSIHPSRVLDLLEVISDLANIHGVSMDEGETMAHECPEIDGHTYTDLHTCFERACPTLRRIARHWKTAPDYQEEWS